jgi:hypothetical protein
MKAHIICDKFSTLYVKKVGRSWKILWKDSHGDWCVLGSHNTLWEAKCDAQSLLNN